MPPPEPEQPPGQDELERRVPGYRRIVIPRELTLIELLVSAGIFYSIRFSFFLSPYLS